MRKARKRYHESIGSNKPKLPEGHIQVEYPCRALKKPTRTSNPLRGQFSSLPRANEATNPAENKSTEPKSSAPRTGQIIHMRPAERKACSSRYIDRSGIPVQGYESHLISSDPQKPRQRPHDIVTKKTWSKVLETVIEHNPILFNQAAGKEIHERGEEDGEFGNKNA